MDRRIPDKVAKAGDTMTGDLIINKANPGLVLKKTASGQFNHIVGYTNTVPRWQVKFGDDAAESGSGVGSDSSITRYSDAGTICSVPFTINRANGGVSIPEPYQRNDGERAFKCLGCYR